MLEGVKQPAQECGSAKVQCAHDDEQQAKVTGADETYKAHAKRQDQSAQRQVQVIVNKSASLLQFAFDPY